MQIDAFSLIEQTIVMILSAFCISAGIMMYLYFGKNYSKGSELVNSIASKELLVQHLTLDIYAAERIDILDNGKAIKFWYPGDSNNVLYSGSEFLVRSQGNLMDTFKMQFSCDKLDSSLQSSNYQVYRVSLDQVEFSFIKRYSYEQLMKLEKHVGFSK